QLKELQDIAQWIESSDSTFKFAITEITPYAKPEREGGTDASVFAVQGVPTIHLQTADTKGYDFNYREIWHTERDLYNKSIPEYQDKAAVIMAQIALGIANMDKLIQRSEVYK
ncbi:MAG: M28 family peptidase, partial [Bacteroidales bacterium]